MKKIQKLSDYIAEEIEDAEKYADSALACQEDDRDPGQIMNQVRGMMK